MNKLSTSFRQHHSCKLIEFCAVCVLGILPASATPKPQPARWVASWAAINSDAGNTHFKLGDQNTTLREIVPTTRNGPLLRVELSNEFGTEPLILGGVHLAFAGAHSAILIASANAITFDGSPSVTIPPGGVAISDPVAMTFNAGTSLAISIFLPAQTITHLSLQSNVAATTYRVHGNGVGRNILRSPATEAAWFFLKSVDVVVPGKDGSVIPSSDQMTEQTSDPTNGQASAASVAISLSAGYFVDSRSIASAKARSPGLSPPPSW